MHWRDLYGVCVSMIALLILLKIADNTTNQNALPKPKKPKIELITIEGHQYTVQNTPGGNKILVHGTNCPIDQAALNQ